MNTKFKNMQQEALEIFNNTPSNPVTIENPNHNQCKYPLGEELARAELFCGKPCLENSSYCPHHHIMAHILKNNT